MRKYFCDCCGKEVSNEIFSEIRVEINSDDFLYKEEVCQSCIDRFEQAIKEFEESFKNQEG